MDLAKLIAEKREQILSVAAKHGAQHVRVFGSVARGDFDDKSDVDILISLDGSGLDGIHYFGAIERLREELEQILGRSVDVVDECGLKDRIRDDVLAEAVSL